MKHQSSNLWLTKRSISSKPKRTYLKPTCRFKNKISCEDFAATDLIDSCRDLEKSTDVKEHLQNMELLEKKLKIMRNTYVCYVIFSIAVYFLFWYNSECWALPFQESPCKQTRALPLISTNQSTLEDAVDEFIFALQTQITNFHDAVEMPFIADRQIQSNLTKNKIEQLLYQHSADLVGFGALKREDERLEELEKNLKGGYGLLLDYSKYSVLFMSLVGVLVTECMHPKKTNKIIRMENANSQNGRLKNVKRRVRYLYFAIFVCIAAQFALFNVYILNAYHGNSPVFYKVKCNAIDNSQVQKNCRGILAFSDYVSFSTALNSSLRKSCVGIENSLSSPILEVRQSVWYYESKSISMAIEYHLSLKRYDVDRRTMPRKVGNEHGSLFLHLLTFFIMFLSMYFFSLTYGFCY
ncbi:hypothetical protein Ddc_10239 [Ditylenchus destructor]|nr:hypothetical protein Ddc_10239 [Ditylenchus destructor]